MTATQAESDQTDVSTETEIAADRIEARVDVDVMPRNWPSKDFDVIVLSWGHMGERVNSYSKASIIHKVYESNAAVELHSTDDGEKTLVFKLAEN